MSLVKYAKNELELNGLFDKDSDYGGMIGKAVMELMELFAKQSHSGYSADITLSIFNELAHFRPIGNFEPSIDQAIEVYPGEWQSARRHDVFSKDNGKTWYSIDTQEIWPKPVHNLKAEYAADFAEADPKLLDGIIKVNKS